MPKAKCPVCGMKIEIGDDVEDEDIIMCPECGAELVVVKRGRSIRLEPLEEETIGVEEEEEEGAEDYLNGDEEDEDY